MSRAEYFLGRPWSKFKKKKDVSEAVSVVLPEDGSRPDFRNVVFLKKN
jgi:hypothetical protein